MNVVLLCLREASALTFMFLEPRCGPLLCAFHMDLDINVMSRVELQEAVLLGTEAGPSV